MAQSPAKTLHLAAGRFLTATEGVKPNPAKAALEASGIRGVLDALHPIEPPISKAEAALARIEGGVASIAKAVAAVDLEIDTVRAGIDKITLTPTPPVVVIPPPPPPPSPVLADGYMAIPSIHILPTEIPPGAGRARIPVELSGPTPHTLRGLVMTRNGSDPDHAGKSALHGVHITQVVTTVRFDPAGPLRQYVEVDYKGMNDGRWFEVIFPEQLEPSVAFGASARVTAKAGAVLDTTALPAPRARRTPAKGEKTYTFDPATFGAGDAPSSSRWRNRFTHGRTQPSNKELGLYADPAFHPTARPYEIRDGQLVLRGGKFPAPVKYTQAIGGDDLFYEYWAAVLTSQKHHEQLYGYYEIDVKMPSAAGTWGAGWLLPTDGSWPPEIDIWEVPRNGGYGAEHTNVGHHWSGPKGEHFSVSSRIHLSRALGRPIDNVKDFHKHGLDWRKDFTTYYLDGEELFTMPTRFHKPAFMLLDVAMGGWGGPINLNTGTAEMTVRAIDVWK